MCKLSVNMKYYFKRRKDNYSFPELCTISCFIVGFVTLTFYSFGCLFEASSQSYAKLLMTLFFGACAIMSAVEVFREMKTEHSCNVFILMRIVVCIVLSIVSITCIDAIFG